MMQKSSPLLLALRVSRAAGLAPYEAQPQLRVSQSLLLYSRGFHLLISLICAIVLIVVAINNYHNKGLFWLLWIGHAVAAQSVLVLAVLRLPTTLRNIASILTRSKQICRSIQYNPLSSPRKNVQFILTCTMLLTIALTILGIESLQMIMYRDKKQAILLLRTLWTLAVDFVLTLLTIQFVCLAMEVNSTMEGVNKRLNDLYVQFYPTVLGCEENCEGSHRTRKKKPGVKFINVKSRLSATCTKESVHMRLRTLASAYVSTCGLTARLGDSAGGLLFQLLTFNILGILHRIYSFVYISGSWNLDFHMILNSAKAVLWGLLHFGKVVLLVAPCHDWTEQLEDTRFLVSDFMCEAADSRVQAELDSFFIHLMVNQPSYSAFGFYSVGRPLLLTVAAFVSTYLAVLLEV